ncbi:hypothetical protein Sste5346_000387 [Sporothrix stenoceras]|uniref:DH domain-containing protein n=1 Tax=Sporothrix stenoceras TaxID=5173 RepID=A0ABR3ZTN5_9PEZI
MSASFMAALADDLETETDEVTRGSCVSSPSCDSIQIHRSNLAVDLSGRRVSSRGAVTSTANSQTDDLTTAFPRLVVTEPACVTNDAPSDAEYAGRDTGADDKVQWTTPETQQDGLETGTGSLALDIQQRKPFHKWVKALNRRRITRWHLRRLEKSDQTRSETSNRASRSSVSRRNSSSISSFAYVSAARDASISSAGTSIAPSSRRQRARSSKRLSKTDRSSRASCSARHSEDDRLQTQDDLDTLERSRHRRRIIEEMIETEEGYIGDVKFLMKAYLMLFASSSLVDPGFRLSMYSSLTDIIELHDEILGSLHRVVPNSEYAGIPRMSSAYGYSATKIRRRRSLDVVPEDRTKGLPLYEYSGLSAEPHTAAAVANIFTKIVGSSNYS